MMIGGRAHNVRDVQLIGEAGLPFAEISIRDKDEFYTDLHALKKLRDTHGLMYLAHGPEEKNPWEPDILRKEFLPRIQFLIDCSLELTIPLFTIHFWLDSRFLERAVIDEKIVILNSMATYAADKGVQLCLENLSERADDFSPVFDRIGALGMTLDVGHGELLSEENTAHAFCRDCFSRINHIHLHDNRGGDSPEDDLHLPLGRGQIDFFSILSAFKQKGYDKTMTLEIRPQYLFSGKEIIEDIWGRS